tara:strand:- start:90 stop:1061 length:972 start_codon:yes stop_codon:yes gene_type:complete
MKTLITIDDFFDLYYKIQIKGLNIITDRLGFNTKSRVKNVWNRSNNPPTNWWVIPEIQKRWNVLISGQPNMEYQNYFVNEYLIEKRNLKLLSPGCGNGIKEVKYAKYENFELIDAFDIAPNRIKDAIANSKKNGLDNIAFSINDLLSFDYIKNKYDIVVCDMILHHIKRLDIILEKVKNTLKPGGLLVINEYVGPNRFQFPSEQISHAEKLLKDMPTKFRERWNSNSVKSKIYKPGILRMILADPSEAINSEKILPEITKRFKIIEEKPYGGNMLHLILKDISHNFLNDDDDGLKLLTQLFEAEDEFIHSNNSSDFLFGVYRK